MLAKVSFFFPVVSKELHVSLSNVENVREKEKRKAFAAANEVSENMRRAKILENYNGIDGIEPEIPGEVIHVDQDRAFSAFRDPENSDSDYSDVEEGEDSSA